MITRSGLRRVAAATDEHGVLPTLLALRAKNLGAKQKIREFAGLIRLVREQRPRTVLEIGTLRGGTLWAWSRCAAPDALLLSIDLPGGSFGGGYEDALAPQLEAFARARQRVRLLRMDSHEPATRGAVEDALGGRSIDFAFIDGDHSYAGVRRDFEMYGPLVRGTVAFHDVMPHGNPACEVDRLWREIQNEHQTLEFLDPTEERWDGAWGGIGVVRLDGDPSLVRAS